MHTDNFYYGARTDPKTAASGGLVSPRALYRGSTGKFDLALSTEAEIGMFDVPGSVDDYEDFKGQGALSWLATRRSRLELRAGFQQGHDPFGINRTESATARDDELDIWHGAEGGLLFRYGSPEAILNVEIAARVHQKTYQTNESATRFLDYFNSSLQYTVSYNYSPKTAVLFDFIRSDVGFDNPLPGADSRSGNEYRLRAGVRWLATAKTSGDVRVGVLRREFDETAFVDEGFDWEASMQWAPRARTLLEVGTRRLTQQSYRSDTLVNLTDTVNVGWRQYWTARVNTEARVEQTQTEFVGSGRQDSLYNASLTVDYTLYGKVSLLFAAQSSTRDSNEPTSEFDRYIASLGVRLGF